MLHPAKGAASCGNRGEEEGVELVEPLLDPEDVGRPLDEQVGAEAVAANHLDREASDVANLDLAPAGQGSSLAPHELRRRNAVERLVDLGRPIRAGLGDGLLRRARSSSSSPEHPARGV
jgi:hypothetical protein